MSSLRDLLPYRDLLDDQMTKAQASVSLDDKRTVRSALGGDDNIFPLVIQHAFKRTADFIRLHNLNVYDRANYARVVQFICNGADTCPPGHAVASTVTGAATPSQSTLASVASVPASTSQGRPGGGRVQASTKDKRRRAD